MDDLEQKMGAILSNPQMMQQVMSMAQALGQNQSQQKENDAPPYRKEPQQPDPGFLPEGIDLSMLQKIGKLAGQGSIDTDQRLLLKALRPYLSQERIQKLEKAMRAAKLAGIASVALGQMGQQSNPGR